ncbi:MAG: WbqC family protein [Selenomonadaceae bacterium]|nr:WbqC family protein [Selenomonadaceae bacterium]
MILAANQPYFFPYLGYWQLINAADVFLVADNLAYMRKSWINRNYILINGKPEWFRIQVEDASSFRLIMDTRLSEKNDFGHLLRTLEMAYHKAPYFCGGMDLVSSIFAFDSKGMLSPFLENSIRKVCSYLGIETVIGRSSDYPEDINYRREHSLYYLCGLLVADTYINLPRGQALYDYAEFRRRGIRLRFIDPVLNPYPQIRGEFVPRLSILDAIMFNPREKVHDMLSEFNYVDGA